MSRDTIYTACERREIHHARIGGRRAIRLKAEWSEYASRRVEKNVPLAQVRDLLRHASITRTERYDNQKLENLQAAASRLERGETFDPGLRVASSPSICQVFVKSEADQAQNKQRERVRETATNANDEVDLENWLGVRDDFRNWLVAAA